MHLIHSSLITHRIGLLLRKETIARTVIVSLQHQKLFTLPNVQILNVYVVGA